MILAYFLQLSVYPHTNFIIVHSHKTKSIIKLVCGFTINGCHTIIECMKKLEQKEWVAVLVAVFVVGFFFVFGQQLVSLLTNKTSITTTMQQVSPEVKSEDTVIGMGDQANIGDRVTLNYTGRFTDGKVFDSSLTRNEPFQFVLGSGQVIKGWDQGIVGMRVGGKRTLTIPPELGYGPKDYGPIPGNSTLIFEVELLKVEKPQ